MASLHLRDLNGGFPDQHYLLEKDEVIIGRKSDCDVVVPVVVVSRRHAAVLRIDGRFYVEDMNPFGRTLVSSNGVRSYVKGRALLRDGDEIWFGSRAVIQFRA
jgi:pSer/pThr/pTyr-binding forkhead associated (FHA) protein